MPRKQRQLRFIVLTRQEMTEQIIDAIASTDYNHLKIIHALTMRITGKGE